MNTVVIIPEVQPETTTFIWRHVRGLGADVFCHVVDENTAAAFPRDITWFSSTDEPRQRKSRLAQKLRNLRCEVFGNIARPWSEEQRANWHAYVETHRPDVALAEFCPTALSALPACRETGTPLVVHFHGVDATARMRFPTYRRRLPELFSYAGGVVIVGEFMRGILEDCGCPADKIHLIPCGAPVDACQLSAAVDQQPCRFIAVSSFRPVKGIFHTLRAFAACREQCPEITLTMIGDGPLLTQAQAWIKQQRLEECVTLTGPRPNEEVLDTMASSSAFVQHSLTVPVGRLRRGRQIEGWGVSIAEAAACGLPIVATRHGGIPDQVIDGTTGFLVPEGDWQAMAEKMITLARNPDLRRTMGLAGRTNIEKVGDTKRQLAKLRALLESVAN